jgi:hypothetical protein
MALTLALSQRARESKNNAKTESWILISDL